MSRLVSLFIQRTVGRDFLLSLFVLGIVTAQLPAADAKSLVEGLLSAPKAEGRTRLLEAYRAAPAADKVAIKKLLEDEYHRQIATDPAKAALIRNCHRELVSISSANAPPFSFMIGAQMPTGYEPKEYAIGKGRPSQVVANEIMIQAGSDLLKLAPGSKQLERQGITVDDNMSITEIITQPIYKEVLAMPYRVMFFWLQWAGDGRKLRWDRMNEKNKRELYKAFYDFTKHLLTTYNDSGKTFLIGNWEGDWMLGAKETGNDGDVPEENIRGMIEWLNIRGKAIDDAKAEVPHRNVNVYFYLEINHVNRAREKGIKRAVNAVLPFSRVDYVSISSYEMQGIASWPEPKTEKSLRDRLFANLDYVESNLPPRDIPGKRVFIGEISYATTHISNAHKAWKGDMTKVRIEQARLGLISAKLNLEWGTPFWLWWAVHNTGEEKHEGRELGLGLVDQDTGEKTRLFEELQRYFRWADGYTKETRQRTGALPDVETFRKQAIAQLDRMLADLTNSLPKPK